MNNSEKKYGSLECILADAILDALINKAFCNVANKEGKCSMKVADVSDFWNGQKEIRILLTSDTEPDETKEKPVKDVHNCNGNCKNKCKSCGENNSEIDMEVVKNYCYNLSCCLTSVINDEFCYTGRITKKILYCSNLVKNLEKALGIKNGE